MEMATIRKRTNTKSARWEARVRRQNYPAIYKLFTLKADAEKWARDAELKIEKGVFDVGFDRSNETLGDILERYLREVTPKKKGHSVEGIRLKKIIRNPIAATKIGLLKPIHIVRFRDERLKLVPSGTVKKELVLLGHVIETAMREWNLGISSNPVRLVRSPVNNPQRQRRLQPGEERFLLCSCRASQNHWLSSVVLLAMKRLCEGVSYWVLNGRRSILFIGLLTCR